MSTNETGLAIRLQDLSPEYAEIMVLGKVLQMSGYFTDVRDQAQAVTKILYGRELGFSPIVSMSGIHIIEGKPALSSNLMATMIKRSGKYNYRVTTWTNDECVLVFREKIDGKWEDVGEASFSIDDAKRARVKFEGSRGPSGWTKFPKAMLFARALSQGVRAYCPDVSAAPIYVPEEMGAEVNEDGDVVHPKNGNGTQPLVMDRPADKPISFKKPQESAAPNVGQGGDVPLVKGPSPLQSADQVGRPVASTLASRPGPSEAEGSGGAHPPSSAPTVELPPMPDDGIGEGQAKNFYRSFREALRKDLRKDADELAHEWLRKQGIVDVLGKPSAYAIKKASFYDVREAAEVYAQSL
jgi:hypothetical protein